MALQLVPKLNRQLTEIRESQEMLRPERKNLSGKLGTALRHTSTLVGWSLEGAVEQTDSMKARGYGLRRRTTFHLFHFDYRDLRFFCGVMILFGVCVIARAFGHGTMEFYPRMDAVITGQSGILLYILFGMLAFLPAILEGKEALVWRSCGLTK